MKTQYTPSPWKVSPDPQWVGLHPLHECRYVCTADTEWSCFNPEDERSDQRWICESGRVICTLTDAEEQRANARLIAAAPDLLEALRGLVRQLIETCKARKFNDGPLCSEVECARAAIAKAEGREG